MLAAARLESHMDVRYQSGSSVGLSDYPLLHLERMLFNVF